MMLIIDQILGGQGIELARGLKFTKEAGPQRLDAINSWVRRQLTSAEVIDASNVSDYFWGSDRDVWNWEEDYPSLAPPFPSMWFEMSRPSVCRANGKDLQPPPGTRTGVLVCARDPLHDARTAQPPDREARLRAEELWAQYGSEIWAAKSKYGWGRELGKHLSPRALWALHEIARALGSPEQKVEALQSRGVQWELQFVGFWREGGVIYGPYPTATIQIRSDGSVIRDSLLLSYDFIPTMGYKDGLDIIYKPVALAISFMHCRNVAARTVCQQEAQPKTLKRKDHRRLVKYRVLEIEPLKEVLRSEGRSESTGLRRALHICRGHFKDYRQSGLFGKIKGIFWWDSMVRGTAEAGVVAKDYSVKAPA